MDRVVSTLELRAENRRITGLGLPFRQLSPSHRERFEPIAGGVEIAPSAWLNLDHKPREVVAWRGAGLEVRETDKGLEVEAVAPETPAGEAALSGIRDGTRAGLSVEFRSVQERREGQTGTRILEAFQVAGFGIVRAASYPGTEVEVRQRTGPGVTGTVALGEDLSCRCRTGCDAIRIEPRALDAALAEAEAGDRVITAFMSGNFEAPLARIGSGLTVTRTGNELAIAIDGLPASAAAAEFLEAQSVGGLFTFRPYFPNDTSTFTKRGTTAIFSRADLRGIEIAPITGPRRGLREVEVRHKHKTRRRIWL